MPPERWGPSWGLRILAGIQAICYLSLGCVLMWFFFPHVLLVPAAAVFAAAGLAVLVLPFRVVLDPGRGEVAITVAFWTRHVPLTEVARVEESGRLGAEIVTAGGWSFGIGPFRKRRWLAALLRPRLRTGFEGMEAAVTQAAEVARAGAPAPAAGSVTGVGGACLMSAAGLLALAVAVLVRPQTGGWLVHAGALALRIVYGATGAAIVLIGVVLLYRAWHNRRVAGQLG
jgi:hypothetical protein